ncbi:MULTISPECIES: hypothetical protein [Streptomyces]|uniref:Minor tail protein n=1 Tax=Streptomyces dengpaensis TaxID=2049881 RepID=A0ABN5I4H3_9ACTN|nr:MULTISPECIES: hypothetical protein [Streptomyces]AVH57892.1 hypothetical protein C4B68_21370 [Streptomyces dengpaensis]PIB03925.1 hypothetical protein B1C81_35350 [Streptomyces sp. HG99]
MAFPDTPLDSRFELFVGGVWIPVRTYERDGIEVETGRRDMASQTDPGRLSITIDNRSGVYSPRNPLSPYYGQIGRNTRCRLSVPGTVSYLVLDGNPANYASTPDHTSLDILGDIDVRWEGEADWYRSEAQMLIGKWADGQRSWSMRLQDGSLFFLTSPDGTNTKFVSWTLPALPRRAALRATLDADNGAGGWTMTLYWAQSLTGPWTQFGTFTGAGATTVFNSTSPVTIAPDQSFTDPQRHPMDGRVYKAEVRNGINGTVVASPDFTAQAAGTTSFADSAGRTWTLSGTATIRDRADLIVGEVPEWPQHWQPDDLDAWVPIEGAGILRRMGQGKKALDSSLRRRIPSFAPLAYWPMEEGKNATRAYSPIAGVPPLTLTRADWAAADSLDSSNPLPQLASASGDLPMMMGRVPAPTAPLTSWSVQWVYRLDQGNSTRRTFLRILSTGTLAEWYIQSDINGTTVLGKDSDGTTVITHNIGTGLDLFGQWVRVRVAATQNGGTVDWTITWTDVGGDNGNYSNSFTGTVGRPTGVASPPDGYSSDLDGMAIGHISAWPSDNTTAYLRAIDAWTGETAWDRVRRLATEENVPLASIPGTETTQQVGPQAPDTLLNLLQAAADADGALLLEDRTRPGLVFRERSSLYNQTPKLTLSYSAAPGLAAPLVPVDDDTAVRNDRTVVRDGGSEARAVLEDGPLSVQDPPDGIGIYDDSVTLSLHDDAQAEPIAYWRLHLGTLDGPRYPTVRVLLHKAPNLIPQVLALGEGDLIRITGLPAYAGFGDVDLLVEGIRHEMGLQRWEVTFNCSPAEPWNVGITDDPVYGKADTDGSELATAATSTATALNVLTTEGLVWTTDGAELPFDIKAGGEVMTVTGISSWLRDTFTRTVSNGWGTPDAGSAWSTVGGGAASDYSVGSGYGVQTLTSVGVSRRTAVAAVHPDCDITCDVTTSALATGDSLFGAPTARMLDGSNMYLARLEFATSGSIFLNVRKIVADVQTSLGSYTLPFTHVAGTFVRVRFQVQGSVLRAKAWRATDAEPGAWHIEATDTALTAANQIGTRSISGAGNTNTNPQIRYDNFSVINPQKFTVTRSVNGVVKAQSAGADVRLAHPAIVAL